MGLWDKVKSQFIDVIEWTEDAPDVLVYRFPRADKEIKMGAKLTVRETQYAVFVNEGQVADIFAPGLHELSTKNLPILTTLRSWPYGFNSPFKAEVYFFNLRQFTDVKWGTANPISLRDPEIGPVRVRAFGNFSFTLRDPREFIKVSGTRERTTVEDVAGQLRTAVVNRFTDIIANSKIPFLDMASRVDQTGQLCQARLAPDFAAFGLALNGFLIENFSLPPEVEKMLDKRSSMGIISDLQKYTQFEVANSIQTAAANTGGMAGMGVGMGAGIAMGQTFAQALGGQPAKAVCAQCQKANEKDAKFCSNCGQPLS